MGGKAQMKAEFGEFKLIISLLAVATAAIFCGLGVLFIKVDVFTKLDPNHPMAKRDKHFHKKFGITFIVFSLVWLVLFTAAINQ